MPTRVVNVYHGVPFDEYCGRDSLQNGGELGNPHPVGRACWLCDGRMHQRGEAVKLFRVYFINRVHTDSAFRESVLKRRGKVLACTCKPKDCHVDVIAEWIDSQPEVP